jgi:hypothetical protein
MTQITTTSHREPIDGWRSRQVFDSAVAGANDTGTWSDSPCPSHIRKREIDRAKSILRKAGIRHRTKWAQTSNVFCVSQQILVSKDDRAKAIELLAPLKYETELLWVEKE